MLSKGLRVVYFEGHGAVGLCSRLVLELEVCEGAVFWRKEVKRFEGPDDRLVADV